MEDSVVISQNTGQKHEETSTPRYRLASTLPTYLGMVTQHWNARYRVFQPTFETQSRSL